MIYLVHFQRPYKHARHYLGHCEDGQLTRRLDRHLAGNGSRLMRAVALAGIRVTVTRTWEPGGRDQERELKNRHQMHALCPMCADAWRSRRNLAARRRYRAKRAAKRTESAQAPTFSKVGRVGARKKTQRSALVSLA